MASLPDVLASSSLSHLADALAGHSLEDCARALEQSGRPAYLKTLKEIGIEKLSDRQKLATAIGKAAKGLDLVKAPASAVRNRGLTDIQLAKECAVDSWTSKEFIGKLEVLAPLGESGPLPGEAADAAATYRPTGRIRLIVLYGSGHKASDLDEWRARAPKWLELRVLELPGHGSRIDQGLWSIGNPCPDDSTLNEEELYAKIRAERDAFIETLADELQPLLQPEQPVIRLQARPCDECHLLSCSVSSVSSLRCTSHLSLGTCLSPLSAPLMAPLGSSRFLSQRLLRRLPGSLSVDRQRSSPGGDAVCPIWLQLWCHVWLSPDARIHAPQAPAAVSILRCRPYLASEPLNPRLQMPGPLASAPIRLSSHCFSRPRFDSLQEGQEARLPACGIRRSSASTAALMRNRSALCSGMAWASRRSRSDHG